MSMDWRYIPKAMRPEIMRKMSYTSLLVLLLLTACATLPNRTEKESKSFRKSKVPSKHARAVDILRCH